MYATNPTAERPCTGVPFAVAYDNLSLEKECINENRIKTLRISCFKYFLFVTIFSREITTFKTRES